MTWANMGKTGLVSSGTTRPMSPALLLALVFANGIGLAMRWPVFAAIIPEIVPRPQLTTALALNAVAMNISRVVGPLLAGAIIELMIAVRPEAIKTLARVVYARPLVDGSGTVQTQYTYEPFGTTTVSGQANANPNQYTGRENDGTGLYYYRARYYHPGLQRFISEDPIGFAGGDTNLYAYVGNAR